MKEEREGVGGRLVVSSRVCFCVFKDLCYECLCARGAIYVDVQAYSIVRFFTK